MPRTPARPPALSSRPAGPRQPRSARRWRGLESGVSIPGGGRGLIGREPMANESRTVRRTVQFKFTLPNADSGHLASLVKAATPFYEAFGGRRVRLLQNVDDPARFMHEIEYDAHEF